MSKGKKTVHLISMPGSEKHTPSEASNNDSNPKLPHNLGKVVEKITAAQNDLLHSGGPICIVDLDGRIVYANPAFEEISDNILSVDLITNAITPNYSPDEIKAIVQAGGPNPFEYTIDVNGEKKHFIAKFHHNITQGLVSISLTPNDKVITSREALLKTNERMSDLARLVADWMWETDRNLNMIFASQNLYRILGFHPSEILGRTFMDLPFSTPNRLTAHIKNTKAPKPFRDFQVELTHRDGSTRILLFSGLPHYDKLTGEFCGYRGSARDITEDRKQEKALQSAKNSAEIANKAKSELLANMSHELRTPLNAIIGFSEIMSCELLGKLGNSQYQDYAKDIQSSASHLLDVINDILDVSKIESGKLELIEETICPNELVTNVVRLVQGRAKNQNQTIEVFVEDPSLTCVADTRKIKQILLNLLSNALKFTPEGGSIIVNCKHSDNGELSITVKDTGIGIAEDKLALCFEPFAQIDSTLSRQFEGTGLGLPLAKGLAELHGGELFLTSREGEGTTAHLTLPASRIKPSN